MIFARSRKGENSMAKLENLLNAKAVNYPTLEQRDTLGMYDWLNDNKITKKQ